MSIESIKVPNLGDSKDVEVIELLVTVGQSVKENDSLLVLESDKAAMEIPAPMDGVVKNVTINLGDQVSEGDEILTLEIESSAEADKSTEEISTPASSAQGSSTVSVPPENDPVDTPDQSANSQSQQSRSTTEIVKIPDLGEEGDVEVIEVHICVGDDISEDDTLITLESDKAAMDVPSPLAGKIKNVKIAVGDKVGQGAPILELVVLVTANESDVEPQNNQLEKESVPSQQSPATEIPRSDDVAANTGPSTETIIPAAQGEVYAGPAVRKLARELGITLTQVRGTGSKHRIIKEDIHNFVKTRLNQPQGAGEAVGFSPVPDIDFSQFGEIEQVQLSKLHRLTAINMHRSWSVVPHVAQFNQADITELEAFRAEQKAEADRRGTRLTFLPFLLKACAKVLQEYPQFNVSLHSSAEYLIQKKYIHIGVAVATKAGLVVPVIRDVDKKTLWELSVELIELTDKAKQRRLSKDAMQGACFTISSLGAIGGTGFIPIVNTPEVAILGVAKTAIKPVYLDNEFVPRKMLPLTLSYDHRAVNGVDGGLFASLLVKLLEDIRLLLL